MSNSLIQFQCLSLQNAAEEEFLNVLLYFKKLTPVPTLDGSSTQLEEKDPESASVIAFNDTYNLSPDTEFFQILFLDSKNELKIIADIIFYRSHLLNLLEYRTQNGDIQQKFINNAPLEHNYTLTFSIQFGDSFVKTHKIPKGIINRKLIQGHSMFIKQLSEPFGCAICNTLTIGYHQQVYKCEQCLLITHKKCHQYIPFRCQKASNSKNSQYIENDKIHYHFQHEFRSYEPSFIVLILPCKNCGRRVSQTALKCRRCKFIIHKECFMSVPPMCGISYEVRARLLQEKLSTTSTLKATSEENDSDSNSSLINSTQNNTTINEISSYSITPSINLAWLDPLSNVGLDDLPKFSDFECIDLLGEGCFSKVYCVKHIPSEKYVAIKFIDGKNESARQQFDMERQILFRFSQQNPYMIKAYCSFHQGTNLFLVMEYLGQDTLKRKLQKQRMNENDIRYYLVEIISVIQYLHSHKVVYRDLKLEHILVCSDGHIHLIDYGLGRILNTSEELCHTICGTLGYVSPEVRHLDKDSSANGYSYPVDYWAIGKMLVEMLCGQPLDFVDELNDLSNFAEELSKYRHISVEARSLVRGLLEIDPNKRLGSPNSPHGSIRDHPFFKVGKEINWDEIDDGVFKSIHGKPALQRSDSDTSIDIPFSIHAKRDWINAGESKCESSEQEQLFRSFDYIDLSTWNKLIRLNNF